MPDPIDELDHFSIPGPPMNPLPAAEVRRRGDRIRRRNNALATVGGLAVVAAIAAPIALAVGGDQTTQQQIGPASQPPDGWVQMIPAGFDQGALPDGATFEFDVREDNSVLDDVTVCGTPAFSTHAGDPAAPAVDAVGASYGEPGTSASADRTVALYADAEAASTALDELEQAVLDCPEEERGGSRDPLVNAEVDVAVPGAERAFVWTNQVQGGDQLYDLTAFEVAQVGNALFLANAHTTAGGEQAMGTVDALVANGVPVVDQMCVFSVEGCDPDDDPSEGVDETTGLSGTIPDDLPLEKGLPTDQSRQPFGIEGPSHDLDLAVYNVENSVQACGVAPTGLPEPVDTLYAGYRSPAEGILRQLMTFDSVEQAQAYVDGVIAPFEGCPEDSDGGLSKVYEVTQPDLGDATLASTMRVEADGEPGVGYQVVAATRVGQAVLFTLINNDGETIDERVPMSYLEQTQTVLDEMD